MKYVYIAAILVLLLAFAAQEQPVKIPEEPVEIDPIGITPPPMPIRPVPIEIRPLPIEPVPIRITPVKIGPILKPLVIPRPLPVMDPI